MENVLLFPVNALEVSHGTTLDVILLLTLALQALTIMESNVYHTLHAIKAKSGMILFPNVSALPALSTMVSNVLNVPQDNSTLTEDVSALMEHSLMDLSVNKELLTNVLVLPTPTGTELTVFASLATPTTKMPVSAKVSSWETTVRDAPQNLTQSSETEFANVILDMSN